jgi:hypothetical protein
VAIANVWFRSRRPGMSKQSGITGSAPRWVAIWTSTSTDVAGASRTRQPSSIPMAVDERGSCTRTLGLAQVWHRDREGGVGRAPSG